MNINVASNSGIAGAQKTADVLIKYSLQNANVYMRTGSFIHQVPEATPPCEGIS
jgi:hypothetical protein